MNSLAPFVPIPTRLIDDHLPYLKDTELRVLLVVYRQTAGRRDPAPDGRMKARRRDWISHRQLTKKTGRSSEAISAAIARLADQGLLVVETESGQALRTAAERRRHLGRLYYRPIFAAGNRLGILPR